MSGMSVMGHKRTDRLRPKCGFVRFGSKADVCGAQAYVRFVPIATSKLAVTLSRISDKYRRARQGDDDFGELAGLRINVD